uniref:Uncharacterized protein n=1 Tax=Trichuris muris TaxID=70415 RepID=A0A5S6R168_TRIMR
MAGGGRFRSLRGPLLGGTQSAIALPRLRLRDVRSEGSPAAAEYLSGHNWSPPPRRAGVSSGWTKAPQKGFQTRCPRSAAELVASFGSIDLPFLLEVSRQSRQGPMQQQAVHVPTKWKGITT